MRAIPLSFRHACPCSSVCCDAHCAKQSCVKCSHSLNRKCNVRFAAVSICFLSRKIVRHISGRSFVCRARAVSVAECRVFVKNLHFAVTRKAIADALNHAGFLVSRTQIQRSGLRFQQPRYCYAFLTVPNEEVQAALVSRLDEKMHPALSDKALFAEPAVPRMRNAGKQCESRGDPSATSA